jgi:hypothetical protein
MQIVCQTYFFRIQTDTYVPYEFCFQNIENSRDVLAWCYAELGKPSFKRWMYDLLFLDSMLYLYFKYPDDAVLLKLTWL